MTFQNGHVCCYELTLLTTHVIKHFFLTNESSHNALVMQSFSIVRSMCAAFRLIVVLFWLLMLFQDHVNDQQQQQNKTMAQKCEKKSVFDALFCRLN